MEYPITQGRPKIALVDANNISNIRFEAYTAERHAHHDGRYLWFFCRIKG